MLLKLNQSLSSLRHYMGNSTRWGIRVQTPLIKKRFILVLNKSDKYLVRLVRVTILRLIFGSSTLVFQLSAEFLRNHFLPMFDALYNNYIIS